MKGTVSHLNPAGLHRNPAFSQVITTSGQTRTIYVGGQNAVDSAGTIVGKGDIGVQAKQVARNLQVALASANASVEHIVKWVVYVVQGQPLGPAIDAFQQVSPVRSGSGPPRFSPRGRGYCCRSGGVTQVADPNRGRFPGVVGQHLFLRCEWWQSGNVV
jgi:enamine deaminase RidA (YjgF/YER057c/UK114 family)